NVTAMDIFGVGMDMLNELHSVLGLLKDAALDASNPAVGAQIRSTIDQLDVTHNGLLRNITELAGRQDNLGLLSDSNEEVSLGRQRIEGELAQREYGGATIELNNNQLALQATQKRYWTIKQLSQFSSL